MGEKQIALPPGAVMDAHWGPQYTHWRDIQRFSIPIGHNSRFSLLQVLGPNEALGSRAARMYLGQLMSLGPLGSGDLQV